MGVRGPVPAKRTRPARTADGVKLRKLPSDSDGIFRRSGRDIPGITPADVALLELRGYWMEIAKDAMRQMRNPDKPDELTLTVQDTTHGDGTEMRKNALLIVLRSATEQIRAIDHELGASPMARARMPEVRDEDQLSFGEQFFKAAAEHLKASKRSE